jgi:hypothetical protein
LREMRWTPQKFAANQRSHADIFSALVAGDAERARREMCFASVESGKKPRSG